MPLTFFFLQAVNAALAAASIWIHFRNPALWDDQAILFSTLAGTFMACLTAILLGMSMLLSGEDRGRSNAIHLILTLAFAGAQGYLLYLTGKDIGLLHLIRSKFG